jgi:hypothetical protein
LANVWHLTTVQRSGTWEHDDLGSIIYSPITRKWWAPFSEIFRVLEEQIWSEVIALLVPTRLVVLGQSKGLNRIVRMGVIIDRLLTT